MKSFTFIHIFTISGGLNFFCWPKFQSGNIFFFSDWRTYRNVSSCRSSNEELFHMLCILKSYYVMLLIFGIYFDWVRSRPNLPQYLKMLLHCLYHTGLIDTCILVKMNNLKWLSGASWNWLLFDISLKKFSCLFVGGLALLSQKG